MITPFPSGRKRRPLSVWNSSPSARLMGCPAPVGNSTVGEGCFTPLDATHFPSGDMSRAIPEPNRIAGEPSVWRRKTVYSAPLLRRLLPAPPVVRHWKHCVRVSSQTKKGLSPCPGPCGGRKVLVGWPRWLSRQELYGRRMG